MAVQSKISTSFQNKFQSILSYPAVIVPSLSEDDIKITLLEAILDYLEEDMPLTILVDLAETIQQYMGMRGSDCSELYNALTTLSTLAEYIDKDRSQVENHINEILLQTLDSFTTKNS